MLIKILWCSKHGFYRERHGERNKNPGSAGPNYNLSALVSNTAMGPGILASEGSNESERARDEEEDGGQNLRIVQEWRQASIRYDDKRTPEICWFGVRNKVKFCCCKRLERRITCTISGRVVTTRLRTMTVPKGRAAVLPWVHAIVFNTVQIIASGPGKQHSFPQHGKESIVVCISIGPGTRRAARITFQVQSCPFSCHRVFIIS